MRRVRRELEAERHLLADATSAAAAAEGAMAAGGRWTPEAHPRHRTSRFSGYTPTFGYATDFRSPATAFRARPAAAPYAPHSMPATMPWARAGLDLDGAGLL